MKKKFGMIMVAMVMGLIGMFSVNAGQAGAQIYFSDEMHWETNNYTYGGTASAWVREDANNIYVTVQDGMDNAHYATVTVQRYYNYKWNDIESKTGYIERQWGVNKKFNPTFYGYAWKGQRTRVRVYLKPYMDAPYNSGAWSSAWTR